MPNYHKSLYQEHDERSALPDWIVQRGGIAVHRRDGVAKSLLVRFLCAEVELCLEARVEIAEFDTAVVQACD